MKAIPTQHRPIRPAVSGRSSATATPGASVPQKRQPPPIRSQVAIPLTPARESPDATLAKNLVVARQAASLTQHQLAAAALVSRATVAQIETGCSDPRLSTIVDLARALGVPPFFLLVGSEEVDVLIGMPAALLARPLHVPSGELERMQRLIRSGMLKDRVRAARIGAAAVAAAGRGTQAATVSAAIFSAIQPEGVGVGTVLGELAESHRGGH